MRLSWKPWTLFGLFEKSETKKKIGSKSSKVTKKPLKDEPPKPGEVVAEEDVVVEDDVPNAQPVHTTTDVLGSSLKELEQRLKRIFPSRKEERVIVFYLLAPSQAKGQWLARPVATLNKLVLAKFKELGIAPTRSLEVIEQMKTDGLLEGKKKDGKMLLAPTWALLKLLLPVEEDLGFALALDEDGTPPEGMEVVVLEEETTELLQPK